MGGAGSPRGRLPRVRGGGAGMEVAERGGERAAGLLGKPGVVGADRTRAERGRRAESAAHRGQEMVFIFAKHFRGLASGASRGVCADPNGVRELDDCSGSSCCAWQARSSAEERSAEGSRK